eukprot:TRINITY_DN2732_c1_g1_i1.p1 TRINITY_DN2732_c1_g1~~TRINITY_DN2732_c1_g1_i1.p1  ORF type:complete len:593 (+),score=151.26 TRINITY_DN2732_c1_g1_i1:38-1816(+)
MGSYACRCVEEDAEAAGKEVGLLPEVELKGIDGNDEALSEALKLRNKCVDNDDEFAASQAKAPMKYVDSDSSCDESDSESDSGTTSGYSDKSSGESDEALQSSRRRETRMPKKKLKMVETMGFIPSAALLVVPDNRGKLSDNYEVLDWKLGEGGFAVVKKAKVKVTGAWRAVKLISKSDKNNPALLKAEIEILKMLDHPHVVTLFELFEDDNELSLVMELCCGGQLEKYVENHGCMSEVEAAITMKHVLRAVSYLHSISIVHRDIKAANCLLMADGAIDLQQDVKLSDFGLSTVFKKKQPMTQRAGTPSHMAPEVFAKHYFKSVDVWSTGVMLYFLISHHLAFGKAGFGDENTKDKLRLGFAHAKFVDASQDIVNLLTVMLARNPAQRIKPEKALLHPWMSKTCPEAPAEILEQRHVDNLFNYRKLNKFKRACLNMMACMLGESDIGMSRRLFIALDDDGNGRISLQELVDKVQKAAISKAKAAPKFLKKQDFEQIFHMEGEAAKGLKDFSYTEFVAATFNRKKCINERLARCIFRSFDHDLDGKISMSELASGKLLGHLDHAELMQTLQDLDQNGDAEIDFKEFMAMLRGD